MKLLTKEIEKKLPTMYSTENVPLEEKKVIAKFFTPWAGWTWFAVEASALDKDGNMHPLGECVGEAREDVIFFGLVDGQEREWGCWHLSELERLVGPHGLKIERDRHFDIGTPIEKAQ